MYNIYIKHISLSTYLFIYLSIYSSITYLHIYSSITYLCIYSSINLSSTYPSIHPSSIYLFIHLSSIYLSIHLSSLYLSIHLPTYLPPLFSCMAYLPHLGMAGPQDGSLLSPVDHSVYFIAIPSLLVPTEQALPENKDSHAHS